MPGPIDPRSAAEIARRRDARSTKNVAAKNGRAAAEGAAAGAADAARTEPDADLVSDAELMLRFQRGDETAYEFLVRRHLAFVIRHARRYLAEESGAEDVAQEVFLRLYRSGQQQQFRDPSNFLGWLATMTTRLALNELRTRSRKRWLPRSQLSAANGGADSSMGQEWRPGLDAPSAQWNGAGARASADSAGFGGDSDADPLLQDEMTAIVRAAIATLPERQRLAIELQRFEDFELEQIGAVLEMTVPAVKSLLHRARAALLEKLAPYFEIDGGATPKPAAI
ncbi:MAG: RNA polymerase sigma factor [Planctomycetota bacterium]